MYLSSQCILREFQREKPNKDFFFYLTILKRRSSKVLSTSFDFSTDYQLTFASEKTAGIYAVDLFTRKFLLATAESKMYFLDQTKNVFSYRSAGETPKSLVYFKIRSLQCVDGCESCRRQTIQASCVIILLCMLSNS
jgi:hypothetical protein